MLHVLPIAASHNPLRTTIPHTAAPKRPQSVFPPHSARPGSPPAQNKSTTPYNSIITLILPLALAYVKQSQSLPITSSATAAPLVPVSSAILQVHNPNHQETAPLNSPTLPYAIQPPYTSYGSHTTNHVAQQNKCITSQRKAGRPQSQTVSQSVTVTVSPSHSHSHSQSQSRSQSVTVTVNLIHSQSQSESVTVTVSHRQSQSQSVKSQSVTVTDSHSQSQSQSVRVRVSHSHRQSQSVTVTVTYSHSQSQSQTSHSQSQSQTNSSGDHALWNAYRAAYELIQISSDSRQLTAAKGS
jgi:hypothetical protein